MTVFVDTNILVRHPTQDPPAMGTRATRFLAESAALHLADLILAEVQAESAREGRIASFDKGIDCASRGIRLEPT